MSTHRGGRHDGPHEGHRVGSIALGTALCVGFILMVLEAFYLATILSTSVDEAWIAEGVRALAETGSYAHRAGLGATTTGGAYTVVQLAVVGLSGGSLVMMRWVSLVALLLLAWQIWGWARKAGSSRLGSLLAVSALAAVPGTVALASTAFAAILATWLVFVAIALYSEGRTLPARIAAGFLFGLAAATRLNLVLALPALVLAQVCLPKSQRPAWTEVAGVVCVGGLVFAGGYALLSALAPDVGSSVGQAALSAGVSSWSLSWPEISTRWSLANALVPIPVCAASTAAALWLAREDDPGAVRALVLVAVGWTLFVFWLVVPPHPHLRYLWPALAAFSAPLGLALGKCFDRVSAGGRSPAMTLAIAGLGLCLLTTGVLAGLRAIQIRDLNLLTWEWRGLAEPARSPLDGSAARNQRDIAAAIGQLPPGEPVAALGVGFALEVMSGRPIHPLARVLASKKETRWVVRTPHFGRVVSLHPRGLGWLDQHCDEVGRYGDYSLCRVRDPLPAPMRPFVKIRPLQVSDSAG